MVLIGGHNGSGKNNVINEIKKMYATMGYDNYDYEPTEMFSFKKLNDKSVVYCDMTNFWYEVDYLSARISHKVHRIFILCQINRGAPKNSDEYDLRVPSKGVFNFSDLVLSIVKPEHGDDKPAFINVLKDRVNEKMKGTSVVNFFETLSNFYVELDPVNRRKLKYVYDFSKKDVYSFRELFSYDR